MCEDLLQGEFLLFLVEVRKSVQTEGHPQGVHVLLQGLVLVVQTTGRFQQFVQVVFRLLYRAFHLKKKMKSETCRQIIVTSCFFIGPYLMSTSLKSVVRGL